MLFSSHSNSFSQTIKFCAFSCVGSSAVEYCSRPNHAFFWKPCGRVNFSVAAGENTRNFLYVKDVARAFEKILHKAVEGHIYNIGGTNEVSVLQVAKDLMR